MGETEVVNTAASEEIKKDDGAATPDLHGTGIEIKRAREMYNEYLGIEEKPSRGEVFAWYLYGLCSYSIQTALLPIVFPLIISQIVNDIPEPAQGWLTSYRGSSCKEKEMMLYQGLTHQAISIGQWKISPLEWTSISWAIGLILASPLIVFTSFHLDHGHNQQLIAGAATLIGVIFCLPTGFFKVSWIFPPYIAAIVITHTIATSAHTRYLGLMIRGFTGPTLERSQFQVRRGVSSWLSLIAAAVGCFGSALISAFTYRMLKINEKFMSLWVVSIFSGIKWLVGIVHVIAAQRPGTTPSTSAIAHFLSTLSFPQAVGGLFSAFMGSLTTMCIFTAAVLFLVGQLCLEARSLLFLWLTYFIFPLISLPIMHPLQHALKASAVKMQILGFALSIFTSGMGFYFREKAWAKEHILLFAGIQSTSTGLLHAFGKVLILDCSPCGKEGAFSAWHSWVQAAGACAGFAIASAVPGNISTAFGVAFCSGVVGVTVLLYGNVSDYRGAVAAGHVREDVERELPDHAFDDEASVDLKGPGPMPV